MSGVINTNHLYVGYEKKTVIRDVQMNALKGQTICLIGPNGAGKSTVLRTLAGLLAPVKGTVYIGKEDVQKVKADQLARQMAVVLTDRLNVNLTTAYEIVAMGRTPYTGFFGRLDEEDHRIVRESMKTVSAEDLTDRNYISLSDGEKQKVLIARALAQQPSLIILDEPTSHLDIKHKIEVVQILNRLSNENGLTVILALHDVDIAVKSCQFLMMVKDGSIVAQGRPEEIIEEGTIGELYDIEGASFNSILCSLEMKNDRIPEVFIAAGCGTGVPVYRFLSRAGMGIVTGILHENDVDTSIARSMDLSLIVEKSFDPISQFCIDTASEWLSGIQVAIDSGFPLGQCNSVNIDLLRDAALSGKTVFSFRDANEILSIYGRNVPVIPVKSIDQLEIAGEKK